MNEHICDSKKKKENSNFKKFVIKIDLFGAPIKISKSGDTLPLTKIHC